MSLFDTDLVEKDIDLPLKDQFAYDLSSMIRANKQSITSSYNTWGVQAVMDTIETMIRRIHLREKYKQLRIQSLRVIETYDHYNYPYIKYVKEDDCFHVGIRTFEIPYFANSENNGSIRIILDRELNEVGFLIRDKNQIN